MTKLIQKITAFFNVLLDKIKIKKIENKNNIKGSEKAIIENKEDIFSYYNKANNHLENEDYTLAIDCFNKVVDMLILKDLPIEIVSKTAFFSEDMSIDFTLVDIYHNLGCAKFKIGDSSSIDDFNEVIKINKNYENAYYMRGSAYFILLEDWQKAIIDIKKYLTFSPEDKSGNQLLFVLKEIKANSNKINKLYNLALDNYSKGEKMLSFIDDEESKVFDEKKGNELMKSCIKSLDKALELFSQKNRPNIYLMSHSFTLIDIYFKRLQSSLMLQEKHDSIMNQCVNIYKTSNGKFKPNKNELGAKIYNLIKDSIEKKQSSEAKPSKEIKSNSNLRVNWDNMKDIGIVTHYKNKPFTGIAYSLYDNGDLAEEQELVEGLKHGKCTLYLQNGKIACTVNYSDDVLDPKDEEKFSNAMIKVMKAVMMK